MPCDPSAIVSVSRVNDKTSNLPEDDSVTRTENNTLTRFADTFVLSLNSGRELAGV